MTSKRRTWAAPTRTWENYNQRKETKFHCIWINGLHNTKLTMLLWILFVRQLGKKRENGQPRGTTVRKHLVLDKSPNRHTDNNSTHTEEKHTFSTSEEGTPKYVARSTFRPHEDQNLSLQLKTGPSTQEPGQRPQAKHTTRKQLEKGGQG